MTTSPALRAANAGHASRRRRLIAYGQWQPFADAAPVRAHVQALRNAGMSMAGIAKHTGVNSGSLDHLIYGKHPYPPAGKIRTENATAILAFWPTLDDYDDGAVIDATGTRRRIQALAAAGWPSNSIHQHVNHIGHKAVERLRTSRRVTARTARAVRDFYSQVSEHTAEDHGVTPWIAARTRTYAAKNQYARAIAWDDDTIDDPNAAPAPDSPYRPQSANGRDSMRRAEIAHLLSLGESVASIARQMSANEKYIGDLISQGLAAPSYEAAA
ncbi:hypothetical protein ACFVSQ_13465 [Streptomyces niveus]|uniref:hypothetical protein n=1 Tax=Streptomyces niveus TaxID=193462 RepID=UPI0036ED2856